MLSLLLAAMGATLLVLPQADSYVLPVDNIETIKMSLYNYGVGFQSMLFRIPFPNSPWGPTIPSICDSGSESGHDSLDAIHVAEVTISDFPPDTTADDETGDLHFAITSVDHQPLDKPLGFIVTWNFHKPMQRLGRLAYEPALQVIDFAKSDVTPTHPIVPPLVPNRTCSQAKEVQVLEHDKKTQNTTIALTCQGCFNFTYNSPNSLTFSLQPLPQAGPEEAGVAPTTADADPRVQAPDAFGVMHTVDFLLASHRSVVEADYSELGSISPQDHFTVSFWIIAIDGHSQQPPRQHVRFIATWDLLTQVDRRTPRWSSLEISPTQIRFPDPDIRLPASPIVPFRSKGGRKPGLSGSQVPLGSGLRTQQGSSLAVKALLVLAGFLAGIAVPSRPRRRLSQLSVQL
ncbi:uncharacterized protein Z520_06925 [Fonsecaea multimorphosa CBS 102226]|uniref:Uncharacterized protein n=1 Tax=Fonsecaea multimorphosa CBS 102226 TaxID=1442371 RepID=A0A0D2KLG3_9EURO|nr:uncharacterized protein Z520_06925 [Fonsecaea multimorphosa CBS 102226]KIX97473.1 hypothetical protein Z520_06925 [Fonsecaea multimorphosa CBS 102226]